MYRFEPYTVKMPHYELTVWEERCQCGSCDTVNVKTVDPSDGDTEHYTHEGPTATKLDVYDQVKYLKDIILDLTKLIKQQTEKTDAKEVTAQTSDAS